MGCNIVTLGPFSEVNNAVQGNGGCARAIMDDLAVAGDPRDVWPALVALEARLRTEAHLERSPKPRANLVYSASGQYGDMPAGYSVGTNGGGGTGRSLDMEWYWRGFQWGTTSLSAIMLRRRRCVCVA